MKLETAIILNMLIESIVTISEDGALHPNDVEKLEGQSKILQEIIDNDSN